MSFSASAAGECCLRCPVCLALERQASSPSNRPRVSLDLQSTVPTLNGSVKSHAVQLAMNSSHVIVVRELVRPLALKEMAAVICAGAN